MTTRQKIHGEGVSGIPLAAVPTSTPGNEFAPVTDMIYTVSLPVAVHETPDDEAAVAIADIAIVPVYLDSSAPSTMSISVVTEDSLTVPETTDFGPVIPALPESDDVRVRRHSSRRNIRKPVVVEKPTRRRKRPRRPAPEGLLQHALYSGTFHLVNVGDSWAVRQRKALDARIARSFDSRTRFVPVLSRKGGVGATTVTALMAMAFADVRDDRVIAIDTNPDRGTLGDRVTRTTRSTVRDVVARSRRIESAEQFVSHVSTDVTGLDVLASDASPSRSTPLGEHGFTAVADVASQFYALAVTDGGSGVVHAAAKAALQRADAVVIVSGAGVDEARSASELLTWLETNGYGELAENAVLALNTATIGTNLDKVEEIEAHFAARVREIVRIPYDPLLASGSVIHYQDLKPFTREVARDLAALVADGLAEPESTSTAVDVGVDA
ncbi:MAG: MinD/ParA family protein [Rhodoglobus sp.]